MVRYMGAERSQAWIDAIDPATQLTLRIAPGVLRTWDFVDERSFSRNSAGRSHAPDDRSDQTVLVGLVFAGMFEQCNVTVMVTDLDRAIDFYTEVLKLPLRNRYGNEWAELQAPGVTIGLHPQSERISGGATGNLSIGFQVRDLAAAIGDLRQRGLTLDDSAIRDGGGDRIVNFVDPDGTPLYLIELNW
jgi:catechol 2,3-dioxygenase-like lactoylglutathione lyase family enzyme